MKDFMRVMHGTGNERLDADITWRTGVGSMS
jgi:hypothetical protein